MKARNALCEGNIMDVKAKKTKKAKMVPLMLMRTKGLSGPLIVNHKGVSGKSKSVGNTI